MDFARVVFLDKEVFTDVPEVIAAKVQVIDTEAELDALLERVLQANALADMGL